MNTTWWTTTFGKSASGLGIQHPSSKFGFASLHRTTTHDNSPTFFGDTSTTASMASEDPEFKIKGAASTKSSSPQPSITADTEDTADQPTDTDNVDAKTKSESPVEEAEEVSCCAHQWTARHRRRPPTSTIQQAQQQPDLARRCRRRLNSTAALVAPTCKYP